MTNFTFLIVTYNGEYWIKKCLDSVTNASPSSPIILVDNDSSDSTLNIARAYEQVEIIALEENLGFGAANNIGLEKIDYTKCDFVALLNQDAYLEPSAIKNFKRDLESSYGIHAFLQMNGEGDDYDPHFKFDYLKAEKCPGFFDDVSRNKIKSHYPIHKTSAACWLLPKSTIMKIGGFNPTFYHYGEDDNYVNRLHYHDLKVALYPNCKVNHDRIASKDRDFYRDKRRKELRYWITHVANPNRTDSKTSALISLLRQLIILGIKLNFEAFSVTLDKISSLLKLDIIENRTLTQEQGPSFLHIKVNPK